MDLKKCRDKTTIIINMDIEGLPKSSLIINHYLKSVKDVTKILLTLPNLIKIKFLGFGF